MTVDELRDKLETAVKLSPDAKHVRVIIVTEDESYMPTVEEVEISVMDSCIYLVPNVKLWDEIEYNKKDK